MFDWECEEGVDPDAMYNPSITLFNYNTFPRKSPLVWKEGKRLWIYTGCKGIFDYRLTKYSYDPQKEIADMPEIDEIITLKRNKKEYTFKIEECYPSEESTTCGRCLLSCVNLDD